MLVQVDGFKVGQALERITKDKEGLKDIYGSIKAGEIVNKAQRMLDLVAANKMVKFNLQHNIILLDQFELAFIKEYDA